MCHTCKYGWLLNFDQAAVTDSGGSYRQTPSYPLQSCALCISVEQVHKEKKIKGLLKIKD